MENRFSNKSTDQTTLVLRLKNRERTALRELYSHYSGALLNVIFQIVKSKEMAEEVMQDAFVKIWDKIDQYDESKGRLFTWMLQIARNTAIDGIRSGNFKRWEKTDPLENDVNENIDLSESLNIEDSGLRTVVNNLDEKYRLLIDYLYFQDYTQKEASEALDIPLGTVKTRVRMALVELRKILGNEAFMVFIFWLIN